MSYTLPRLAPANGPLEVPELIAAGLSPAEAGMIAWPVSEEAFAAFLKSRRTLSEEDVEAVERRRDADLGQYVPHHHHPGYGEAAH